jgi:hypothetical protein
MENVIISNLLLIEHALKKFDFYFIFEKKATTFQKKDHKFGRPNRRKNIIKDLEVFL